jgi:hypothetical protein
MAINTNIYFWTLNSVPFVHLSICTVLITGGLFYVLRLLSKNPPALSFFKFFGSVHFESSYKFLDLFINFWEEKTCWNFDREQIETIENCSLNNTNSLNPKMSIHLHLL